MSVPYERTVVNGVSHFVCAKCRRAHRPGTDAPYGFPEPGGVPDKRTKKQSLCGACYREAYAFMYPPRLYPRQPVVADNAVGEPIPYDLSGNEAAPRTEQQVWGEAFALWQQGGYAETPQAIFDRLWEQEQRNRVTADVTEVQLAGAGVVEVRRE